MYIKSSNLGFPRIGQKREWKKALEAYWKQKTSAETLHEQMRDIRLSQLRQQKEQGIDMIPVHQFTYYDHMLDMAVMFGLVPQRFSYEGGPVDVDTYFAMARGAENAVACEMTKWFNTNYHYIVPEFGEREPALTENSALKAYREARDELGIEGKPVLVGPYTFVKLSKGYKPQDFASVLHDMVPLYAQVLADLEQEGVQWVQMDEPALVKSMPKAELGLVAYVYDQLHKAAPNLNVMLQTYFGSVEHYAEVVDLPVQGIGLDFVSDGETWESLREHGFPKNKVLGAGLIDGRNIWRASLSKKLNELDEIENYVSTTAEYPLVVQPSCSLLHVPVKVDEDHLPQELKNALAFAVEKLQETVTLARAKSSGTDAVRAAVEESDAELQALSQSKERQRTDVQEAVRHLREEDGQRTMPFADRKAKQQEQFQLPVLPTTTIGSFPQTQEVRKNRLKWKKGELSTAEYEQFIQDETRHWIDIQEDIGLDVFVHGEFERSDMVEYFGQRLSGFAFTKNAWVQSYGSRGVRPPIIYGDVDFLEPMTVKETIFAQSLTEKDVKGMLTGPVTILNWSFVRDDISREQVCYQIALALRKEVEALEQAGIRMIQVDEPALREGLPLKERHWEHYLNWSVYAFRVTTSSVRDTTQIHTHMCYSDFQDIIGAISNMDADVISIETSRSHGDIIDYFQSQAYDKDIGLGVYDIHSPRVPDVEEMEQIIEESLQVIDQGQFWINPDCGLKTRGKEETVAALRTMVEATRKVREKLSRAATC